VRGGLISSVVLHAAILGWALVTIQSQPALPMPEPEAITIDLVPEADVTKLKKGVRTAKQLDAEAKTNKSDLAKKEAPKPAPVPAAEPPPPAKEAAPPDPPAPAKQEEKVAALPPPPPPPPAPPPLPGPEEQKRLEDLVKEQERQAEEQRQAEEKRQAEEQRQAEERKRVEEEERKKAELKRKLEEEKRRKEAELKKKREEEKKRKEAEAKKRFDAEKIAALLNKVPDRGAPLPTQEPLEPTRNKGPALGAPEGRDRQLSASEIAVLQQIIKSCVQEKWTLSGGGQDAMDLVIKLRLQFRPDGTLSAPPQVTNQQNTSFFLAASEGAIRAAQACEPYSLPPEKYEIWRDVIMNFSTRDMFH
jgi:colicin import membrane protein